jgi:hypothetical protein
MAMSSSAQKEAAYRAWGERPRSNPNTVASKIVIAAPCQRK